MNRICPLFSGAWQQGRNMKELHQPALGKEAAVSDRIADPVQPLFRAVATLLMDLHIS
jgi:hypothetical protein